MRNLYVQGAASVLVALLLQLPQGPVVTESRTKHGEELMQARPEATLPPVVGYAEFAPGLQWVLVLPGSQNGDEVRVLRLVASGTCKLKGLNLPADPQQQLQVKQLVASLLPDHALMRANFMGRDARHRHLIDLYDGQGFSIVQRVVNAGLSAPDALPPVPATAPPIIP